MEDINVTKKGERVLRNAGHHCGSDHAVFPVATIKRMNNYLDTVCYEHLWENDCSSIQIKKSILISNEGPFNRFSPHRAVFSVATIKERSGF
jgi:hypothetical protein